MELKYDRNMLRLNVVLNWSERHRVKTYFLFKTDFERLFSNIYDITARTKSDRQCFLKARRTVAPL